MTFDSNGDHGMTEADYMASEGVGGVQFLDLEHDSAWGEPLHRRKKRKVPKPGPSTAGAHYYPQNDTEAKELIDRLGWYRWETHKVSGTFSQDPYWLTTEVGEPGVSEFVTIHLRGRFGSVLTWLEQKTREPNG
jgi:hypothetical protein